MNNDERKLPPKGILETELAIDAFMMLAKGLITHLDIVVFILHKPGFKAKVSVRLTDVRPPGYVTSETKGVLVGTSDSDVHRATGFMRAQLELEKALEKKQWYLYGVTNDSAERHICIVILPEVLVSYAFKEDSQTIKEFNPSLN